MTIQWLSSKRVEGDDADKDTIPVNSLESGYSFTALDTPVEYIWNGVDTWVPIGGVAPSGVGGWKELGRTTLGIAGDSLAVDTLDNKRYYMILSYQIASGAALGGKIQFNDDTGNNYAQRLSSDGGADIIQTSITAAAWDNIYGTGSGNNFGVGYVSNLATNEKLGMCHGTNDFTLGAGTATQRGETVSKWTNTTNPINKIDIINTNSGSYATNSEIVVLGWDPTDDNTGGFWEELASVNGDGSGGFETGNFSAKKYLWVQVYFVPDTGGIAASWTFNSDGGVSYAQRRSNNGATDVEDGSRTSLSSSTVSSPFFINMFIVNNLANEKLVIYHEVSQNTAGAGNAPSRSERVGKWTDTANQITNITFSPSSGNFTTSSIVKVWGHD